MSHFIFEQMTSFFAETQTSIWNNNYFFYGAIFFIILLAFWGLGRLIRSSDEENQKALNEWTENILSDSLSEKLDLEKDFLKKILAMKKPETEEAEKIIANIMDILDTIALHFTKHKEENIIDIELEILYQNGDRVSVTIKKEWEFLPDAIREKFLRENVSHLQVPWSFAWEE